jgi:hypothetical protein
MKVNVVKTSKNGKWALKGVKVYKVKKGLQEMNNDLANELIKAGWAKLPEKEENKPVVVETMQTLVEIAEELTKDVDLSTPAVESAVKNAGWWTVKFEDIETPCKVRGKSEAEAIENAIAELKEA